MNKTDPHLRPWQLHDWIDLEYFLSESSLSVTSSLDDGIPPERRLFLEAGYDTANRPGDAELMMCWLEDQRNPLNDSIASLPGGIYMAIRRHLGLGATIGGGLLGFSAAFSYLNYSGAAPVNVTFFLFVFVGLQFLALTFLALPWLKRFIKVRWDEKSVFLTMLTSFWQSIQRRRTGKKQTKDDAGLIAVAALLKGNHPVYGNLFLLPPFQVLQIFGIWFNLGVIFAILLKVIFTDIAFGWQSTMQIGHDAVFGIVRVLALPWRWFLPANLAYPSLEQIQGSHMILKDGIYHLYTPHLVSWWPFLLLAVIFYGFLPRLILWSAAGWLGNFLMRRLSFSSEGCKEVLRRMTVAHVVTKGEPEEDQDDPIRVSCEAVVVTEPAMVGCSSSMLIPEEIFDSVLQSDLLRRVGESLGYPLLNPIRLDRQAILDAKTLLDGLGNSMQTVVVVLQEAWQPPIREFLNFLKNLRQVISLSSPIHIALIGKPIPGNSWNPVEDGAWLVWSRKLDKLADPHLRLERIDG